MSSSSEHVSKRTRYAQNSTYVRRTLDTYKTPQSVVSTVPLTAPVLQRLLAAMRDGNPLIIRLQLSAAERSELLREWSDYVIDHRSELCQTSDGTAPRTSLGEVWDTPHRIEIGLHDEVEDPLREWLQATAARGSVRYRMQRVQLQLDDIARTWCRRVRTDQETKAFITGRIEPGGGPTHFDEYDNLAFVLTGSKVFYHAVPSAFTRVDLHGRKHERLSVNPFDEVALNLVPILDTHDLDGNLLAPLWRAAALDAGDILFLPHHWWHWVWSQPHTVMTNDWVHRSAD